MMEVGSPRGGARRHVNVAALAIILTVVGPFPGLAVKDGPRCDSGGGVHQCDFVTFSAVEFEADPLQWDQWSKPVTIRAHLVLFCRPTRHCTRQSWRSRPPVQFSTPAPI